MKKEYNELSNTVLSIEINEMILKNAKKGVKNIR